MRDLGHIIFIFYNAYLVMLQCLLLYNAKFLQYFDILRHKFSEIFWCTGFCYFTDSLLSPEYVYSKKAYDLLTLAIIINLFVWFYDLSIHHLSRIIFKVRTYKKNTLLSACYHRKLLLLHIAYLPTNRYFCIRVKILNFWIFN